KAGRSWLFSGNNRGHLLLEAASNPTMMKRAGTVSWNLVVAVAASVLALSAQAQDAPKYSNEFLAIGVGARSLGMGYAQVAAANDVTAGYWNPAGLLGVRGDLQV